MITFVRRNLDQRFIVIFCVVILTAGAFMYRANTLGVEIVQNEFRLNFIPKKYKICEDLVQNSSLYGIELSSMNKLKSKEFEEAVINVTRGGRAEGHSGQV